MIDKYCFEFSKLYCRIMRLEMQMKKKLISSVVGYYKDEVITEFNKFFYNKDRLERYYHKTGNSFLAILRNPQITHESQKFIKLVNIMYLSDILFLFLCCEQFRKPEIINNFYHKIWEVFGPPFLLSIVIFCSFEKNTQHVFLPAAYSFLLLIIQHLLLLLLLPLETLQFP